MIFTRSLSLSVFCLLALTSPLHAVTVNPGGMIGGTNFGPFAWTDLGGDLYSSVYALALDGADLYVGGDFDYGVGLPFLGVAKRNATSGAWTNLGSGMASCGFNQVNALAHDGTDLYVGGWGEWAASGVAKWDAAAGAWTNMDAGMSFVTALEYDGTNLYAGGGGVAKRDAASGVWMNMGLRIGIYNEIRTNFYALASDGTNLYAGGWVSIPGFVSRGCVVKWDAASGIWTDLGSGMDGFVLALAHDGKNLYAGGQFTNAGGVAANYVAKWDAAAGAWTNLGAGMSNSLGPGSVYALAHDGTNLYAGGFFTNAGGVAANYVAKWDTAAGAWTNLGSGMASYGSAPVLALAHDGTNLYAGGHFEKAGGVFARCLAKWGATEIIYSGVEPSSGSNIGGYTVVISGSNLGDGSDITSVTLCGVPAAIQSQSATQIVVTAGAWDSAGPGAVRVVSAGFGETVKSNAFTYSGRGLTVLGSNGAAIASGSAPVPASGARFPPIVLGSTVTNIFSVTNNGTLSTFISRYSTYGTDKTCFAIAAPPTLLLRAGTGSTFSVVYTPSAVGSHTASAVISNNSSTVAYTVNLAGSCCGLSAKLGRFSGGNTITITNGNFGTVTHVLVGGVPATLGAQGATWFSFTLPAAGSAGVKDVVVRTSDNGDITLAGAYTYHTPGADQAIDFPAIEDQWITNRVTLAATASSGLPVSYAVQSGPATLNELSNMTFTAGGTVTIEASQEGDLNWSPASKVTRSFTVLNDVPVAPKALPPRTIAKKAFTARWQWVAGGAPEGELSVATDAGFANPAPGYAARYVCNITECSVTNLVANRDYWYRVRRLTALSGESDWSKAVKVRTGQGLPVFTSLLFDSPAAKGVTQEFALTNLTSGSGVLTVKSTDTNAVSAGVTKSALYLSYLWRGTGKTARVTLSLKHPETGYKSAYEVVLAKAAPVAVVATGALTNAGKRVVQDVTLENRTGGPVNGVRLRVSGLNNPAWMINRSGFSMDSGEAIQEIPCVLPAGSQMVVRVVFHADYAKQAKKNAASYWAGAVIPPLNAIPPGLFGLPLAQNAVYENDAGMRLLGFPVIGNRWYSVLHSDDAGANWVTNAPAIRATFNYMMWLDLESAGNRVYQVQDAGM
jgi:hypothetical protein